MWYLSHLARALYPLPLRMFRYLLILYVLQLVFGIVWIYRGRRRELKDDHPHCQKCGYDLFGLPAPLLICNECGASLTAKGSIEVHFKPRKLYLIFNGISLLIVPVFMLWQGVNFLFATGRWIPYAPTSWVVSAANSNDFITRYKATEELSKRIPFQQLTNEQWEKLAQIATNDRTKPVGQWDPQWDSIMMMAFKGNHLSESTRQQYMDTIAAKTYGNNFSAWEARDDLKNLQAIPQPPPK